MSIRRFPARASLLLRRGAESLIDTAGTRDAAQVAYFLVMSFPAALLLLVWGFSAVLGDESTAGVDRRLHRRGPAGVG